MASATTVSRSRERLKKLPWVPPETLFTLSTMRRGGEGGGEEGEGGGAGVGGGEGSLKLGETTRLN